MIPNRFGIDWLFIDWLIVFLFQTWPSENMESNTVLELDTCFGKRPRRVTEGENIIRVQYIFVLQYLTGEHALRNPIWLTVAQFESGKHEQVFDWLTNQSINQSIKVRQMGVHNAHMMPLPHSVPDQDTYADGIPPKARSVFYSHTWINSYRFYQRDGQLIITQSSPNVQGIRRLLLIWNIFQESTLALIR